MKEKKPCVAVQHGPCQNLGKTNTVFLIYTEIRGIVLCMWQKEKCRCGIKLHNTYLHVSL